MKRILLLFRPGEIFVGFRTDGDSVPLSDEVRDLDHQARLRGGRLQCVSHGSALHAGFGINHLEIYRLGDRNIERGAIEKLDFNLRVGSEKAFDLFNHLGG